MSLFCMSHKGLRVSKCNENARAFGNAFGNTSERPSKRTTHRPRSQSQHDGLITEVENFGYAWQTGLRQGSRLVEINKQPVTGSSHEQMVELLKTSMMVTVTVIPPHPDGAPRRGCNLANCPFAFGARTSSADTEDAGGSGGGSGGDYENVGGDATVEPQVRNVARCIHSVCFIRTTFEATIVPLDTVKGQSCHTQFIKT